MHAPEPVPFRLRMPGKDTIDIRGIRSVSFRGEGLLHLDGDELALEWTVERHTESVSLWNIGTDVDRYDYERTVIPLTWIAEVRLVSFPLPRLTIRSRILDAFDDLPSARPGTLTLRIRRRHRQLAAAMAAAIEATRTGATPTPRIPSRDGVS